MRKDECLDGIQIFNLGPLPVSPLTPYGGLTCDWASPKLGWGQFDLYWDANGVLHADTEHMDSDTDKTFSEAILKLVLEKVVVDK